MWRRWGALDRSLAQLDAVHDNKGAADSGLLLDQVPSLFSNRSNSTLVNQSIKKSIEVNCCNHPRITMKLSLGIARFSLGVSSTL